MRSLTFLHIALALAVLGVAACDSPPGPQTPSTLEIDACVDGGCGVGFGNVDVSDDAAESIRVTNRGADAVSLDATLSGDASFSLVLAPTSIGAGLSGDVIVGVRPLVAGTIRGTVTIAGIDIPLTVNAVDAGAPVIDAAPCAFGDVSVAGSAICAAVVTNDGAHDLVIDGVDVAGDAFALVGNPPDVIAAGEQASVDVRFAPSTTGTAHGSLTVHSNDPASPSFDIALDGNGVAGPTCAIALESVNGVAGETAIAPLDDVRLTLAPSSGAIVAYRWRDAIVSPPGSRAQLDTTSGETAGFKFDQLTGVDAIGTYCVDASVVDESGAASVNDCALCFDARPRGLYAELTWDTGVNDLDLHMTKRNDDGTACITNTSGATPAGLVISVCDVGDCNYANCRIGDAPNVEWDGVEGPTAGDPTLAIDDINGFGPEILHVDAPVPGDYVIAVNEYAGTSSTGADGTVRIFVDGTLAAQLTKPFNVGDVAEIAIVHWPSSGAPCIEDLTDGDAGDDCP